jgi:hypothetical protein
VELPVPGAAALAAQTWPELPGQPTPAAAAAAADSTAVTFPRTAALAVRAS